MLSGCSLEINYEQYIQEKAYTSYNDTDYKLSSETISQTSEIIDNYYKTNDGYKSFFGGNEIKIANASTFSLAGTQILSDASTEDCYDIFGEKFPFSKYTTLNASYIYLAATDSPFYKNFISSNNSIGDELKIIFVNKLVDEYDFFEPKIYYAFQEMRDTHFLAKNTYSESELPYFEEDLIEGSYKATKISETEYTFSKGQELRRYFYQKENATNNFVNNVSYSLVPDYDQYYFSHFDLYLTGGKWFYYNPYKVDSYTNDFTFCQSGSKFKVDTNLTSNIDFYPLETLRSKDGTYAYILCKKIDDDGNLSNKYYSFKINNKGQRGNYSEDISLFDLEESYYKFKNQYFPLPLSEKLLVLKNDFLALRSKGYIHFTNKNYNYRVEDTFDIHYLYSLNNKYYFANTKNNKVSYFDVSTNEFNTINIESFINTSKILIYKTESSIYAFDTYLFDSNDSVTYAVKEMKLFGNNVYCTALNADSKTHIIKLEVNK